MNNPGIDLEIWEQLRKKWADLTASGHKVKVEFKLIADPKDEDKILMIDVIQSIDDEIVTETVQKSAGEAYATLGITGLSIEQLVDIYKKIMDQLHRQTKERDATLIVTMSPSSSTSGEVKAFLEKSDSDSKNNILVNYKHYYILNALRERMIEILGDAWSKVRAVYRPEELEFYFEY
jgi:hypothetical protein